MDENLICKEASVIANCDADYEVPAWKRCSAECLRKLLPNPTCYKFNRRASLSVLDYGSNNAHAVQSEDNGLLSFTVTYCTPGLVALCGGNNTDYACRSWCWSLYAVKPWFSFHSVAFESFVAIRRTVFKFEMAYNEIVSFSCYYLKGSIIEIFYMLLVKSVHECLWRDFVC